MQLPIVVHHQCEVIYYLLIKPFNSSGARYNSNATTSLIHPVFYIITPERFNSCVGHILSTKLREKHFNF